MFFEDEKDNIGNTPNDQNNNDGTVSWEGILSDDEDLVLSDKLDDTPVLPNDSKIKTSESKNELIEGSDDLFAKDEDDNSAELSQILSNEPAPKQKAFEAFGTKNSVDETEIDDAEIDRQLAEFDARSEIKDNEVKISGPKIYSQRSSLSTVLLVLLVGVIICAFAVRFFGGHSNKNQNLANNNLASIPEKTTIAQERLDDITGDDISQRNSEESIPVVNEEDADTIKPDVSEKKEVVNVQSAGRVNPFMPMQKYMTMDVPESAAGDSSFGYSASGLSVPPSEYAERNTPAIKMMTISVSGIMYDELGPSAIITYDGNDYFVQKGDKLDEYKVVDIQRTFVKIALGKNIYKASVGEAFKISSEIYGSAQYLPQQQGGGRQYYSVGSGEYTSEKDVRIKAR